MGKKRKTQKPISSEWVKRFELIPGYDPVATAGDSIWDESDATHVINWIEGICQHVKGERGGEVVKLESWQEAVIGCLFGWKRPDGTRRYREMFFFVPRKNGKTFLSATIVLYVLCNDQESGMEIYSAAADREQAALVYAHAEGMVLQEPELAKRLKIYKTSKSIVNEATFDSYKVISAEAKTKHGFNTHLAIIDETHAQPNRELVDVINTSTSARRQPLIIHATTSDYEHPSICNEKLDYAQKVRDRVIDDSAFLPVLYEAEEEKWEEPQRMVARQPEYGCFKVDGVHGARIRPGERDSGL
jgi:phage terminase large subunit-like protein